MNLHRKLSPTSSFSSDPTAPVRRKEAAEAVWLSPGGYPAPSNHRSRQNKHGGPSLLLLLIALLAHTQALALDIKVPDDWRTITEALNAASNGDTIHVGAGTYATAILPARGESFPLRVDKAVTLEGDPNNRPHLKGDGQHTVVMIETGGVTLRGFRITGGKGSTGVNNMDGGGICVFVGPTQTDDVNITDCVIEDNNCPSNETYDGCGGAIYCGGTYCQCFTIHISDCTIQNNTVHGCGGGVFCALLSNVDVRYSTIRGNAADDHGGGVFVDVFAWLDLSGSDLAMNQCLGDSAKADWGGKGGGLACESFGLFTITDCNFVENEAAYLGGGIFTQSARLESEMACRERPSASHVFKSRIARNRAGVCGGGTYVAGNAVLGFSETTFYWNDAKYVDENGKAVWLADGAHGGAVFVADGQAEVSFDANCLLEGNECTGHGGAIHLGQGALGTVESTQFLGNSSLFDGGALFLRDGAGATLGNCLLAYNNSARGRGGAIRVASQSAVDLAHCSVVGNFAPHKRSGVFLDPNATADIRDSILWRNAGGSVESNGATVRTSTSLDEDGPDPNQAVLCCDPLYVGWGDLTEIVVDASATGPGTGQPGDPYRNLQAALNGFDFHLAAGSPCIGAASDGGNIGTDTGTGGAAGNTTAALHIRKGIYDIRGRSVICTRDIQGDDLGTCFIRHAVLGGIEEANIVELCITGEEIFGGITARADVNFVNCAISANVDLGNGGGIYMANGRCVLTESLVSRNDCTGHHGGGIYLYPETTLQLIASTLADNQAGYGGGCFARTRTCATADRTSIFSNSAVQCGGGLYSEPDSVSLLTRSEVSRNGAGSSGGGIFTNGQVTVTDVKMVDNAVPPGGTAGGIGVNPTGDASILRCRLISNEAGHGGAIYSLGKLGIQASTFEANHANTHAGAIYIAQERAPSACSTTQFTKNVAEQHGGALHIGPSTAPAFVDCNFVQNTGKRRGGAGLCPSGSKATFTDCTFSGNAASVANGRGGGFYLDATQSRFRNCDFDNHQAGHSGGTAYLYGTDASAFEDCRIDGSVAGYYGGALYLMNSAHATFAGGSINNARASKGGGVYLTDRANPRFTGVVFSNCQAGLFGGGIYANGSAQAVVEKCELRENKTTGASADGGGAYLEDNTNVTFTACRLWTNEAKDDGGGIAAAGAATATLLNTLCAANTAGNTGGGAYFTSTSRGTFTNCTVVSNTAYGDSGGGIYLDPGCDVTIDSSILCENVPDAIRPGVNPDVTYSCIPGASVWPGTGNIAADPQLDPGTFWLLDGSPCIDAGNPDPKMNDAGCVPPGKGGATNDMGVTGGPGNCAIVP